MRERGPRTYSATAGRFQFGLAGFWILLALLNTLTSDRLFTVFCLVSALSSGLAGADQLWWHGTNRWFKPAMYALLVVFVAIAVLFVRRLIRDF